MVLICVTQKTDGREGEEMDEEKEFTRLKRKTQKLIQKCDEKGIEFNDIEVSTISRVGNAESMKDLSWLVLYMMEGFFEKYKVR